MLDGSGCIEEGRSRKNEESKKSQFLALASVEVFESRWHAGSVQSSMNFLLVGDYGGFVMAKIVYYPPTIEGIDALGGPLYAFKMYTQNVGVSTQEILISRARRFRLEPNTAPSCATQHRHIPNLPSLRYAVYLLS